MKLLISDLDGTLYPHKDCSNPRQFQDNLAAVKRWIENGNQFAVATARGLHHYSVLIDKLGFDVHFIGSNGASVRLETGEIFTKYLPCSIFIDLCRMIKDANINASAATGLYNKWVWSGNDRYPKGEATYKSFWDSITIADLDKIDPEKGVERIQVFTPPENREALKALIISRNYPCVVTTSDRDMIDIGPLDSSKGISILELCKIMHLQSDNLIVVGDSENDIPMFEMTENSYCIDHAEEKVLKKAAKQAASVSEVIDRELVRYTSDQ